MKKPEQAFSAKYINLPEGFHPEGGGFLPHARVAFHTAGTLNAQGDNVIWICHALTANSNPGEWWSDLLRNNPWLDIRRHFIVCVNIPGSCYGTFGPLELGNGTGLYHRFPQLTIRDIVRVLQEVKSHLRINRVQLLLGASMGGQQALEWAYSEPELFKAVVLLASNAWHSPWGIAFNESQRWAIENDPTWRDTHPKAGQQGLELARSIALLSYRSYQSYSHSQSDEFSFAGRRKPATYQRYQGQKLRKRFNAFSYYRLSQAMDSHDIGRGRRGAATALQQIPVPALIIHLQGDVLFPQQEQQFIAENMPHADFTCIETEYGHDGFLIETEKIKQSVARWLQRQASYEVV